MKCPGNTKGGTGDSRVVNSKIRALPIDISFFRKEENIQNQSKKKPGSQEYLLLFVEYMLAVVMLIVETNTKLTGSRLHIRSERMLSAPFFERSGFF